jgi:hypothetical protein
VEIEEPELSEGRHWFLLVVVVDVVVAQELEEAHVAVSSGGHEIQCFYSFGN